MLDLVEAVAARLAAGGVEDSMADASLLVAAASGCEATLETFTTQRLAGVPTAYVTGRQRFLGVELLVAPGALIPRHETELLGRTALELMAAVDTPRVIDLCCGAGNLACAIAVAMPEARVWAGDVTDGSVTVAQGNVAALALGDRVQVHRGDLFAAFSGLGLEASMDVVVANPPYISTKRLVEGDRQSLLTHEPREAFDGGPYGLSVHQRLIKAAPSFLRPGGHLLFEFGIGQERQVEALFRREPPSWDLSLRSDEAGRPRVAVARWSQA